MQRLNYKKILKFAGTIFTVSAFLLSAGILSSCADDLIDAPVEYDRNPDGTYGPFDLNISLEVGNSEKHTRGSFEEKIVLQNVWIGIFDAANGGLVAMSTDSDDSDDGKGWTEGEVTANSGNHNSSIGGEFVVTTLKNLMINDENAQVYIVGVANYGTVDNDIDVITAHGNDSTLREALMGVSNIIELKNIAVDVASAEKAMDGKNRPLLSGFWGLKTGGGSNGHGNVSIDNEGKAHTNTNNPVEAELFDINSKKITQDRLNVIKENPIHLRRMFSKINVEINHNLTKFENPKIEVYNMPKYVFVQPHTTIEDASKIKSSQWKDMTPNAASKFDDGVIKTAFVLDGDSRNSSNEAEFIMHEGEDDLNISADGKKISFTYWHYETLHWGLPDVVSNMNDREKRYPNSEVYKSLSPSAEDPYNNDAPYFVISGDVTGSDGEGGTYTGNASWIIHEGYCCEPDGDANGEEAVKSRDFSTFRNTQYNYTININGINSIVTKVTKSDLDGAGYAGADGDFWSVADKRVNVADNGGSYSITIPEGKFFWCIKEKQEEDEGYVYYGVELTDPDYLAKYGDVYPSELDATSGFDQYKFYNNITLEKDGKPCRLDEVTKGGTYTVKFGKFADRRGILYICSEGASADGRTQLHTFYSYSQGPLTLKTPVVEMPYAPAAPQELVMGIDDHTIRWKKVEDAESYTIALENGRYSITIRPGETVQDTSSGDDVIPVSLKEDGDYYEFTMRYSNKAGALLSIVQEKVDGIHNTATISVMANAGDYHSEKGTISRKICNPIWDFNSSEWQSAVKSVLGSATGTFGEYQTVLVNGLSVYSGNSTKMKYQKYGSYYAFSPGGTGSKTSRAFSFHAFSMGRIEIWTSSTGSAGTGRYLEWIEKKADGSEEIHLDENFDANGVASGNVGNSVRYSFKRPSVESGPNIWVYPKQDVLIYKIQFMPQDIQ